MAAMNHISDLRPWEVMARLEGHFQHRVPDLAWWCDLRPTKRTRTPIINLEESFDQNSVTRSVCTIKIKKEKFEKVASETRR
ncbi:hypothetical protein Bca4012_089323 [Brassica carinata]|uniref:Uncharacterized protein n=3 Tax=Brassica TaxID=3705 RepID=A0A8S9SN79_BRACR|nr:hypothetical protein F2Q69_00035123 [Brassica cretica]CAF2074769.1 unnamed protein product [Brassica napus]CDY23709.1 BnaC01g24120D [Brassica napus]VDD50962.1 unnamed protein product [Brassica oleracea]